MIAERPAQYSGTVKGGPLAGRLMTHERPWFSTPLSPRSPPVRIDVFAPSDERAVRVRFGELGVEHAEYQWEGDERTGRGVWRLVVA
jgi:hypothetical protein